MPGKDLTPVNEKLCALRVEAFDTQSTWRKSLWVEALPASMTELVYPKIPDFQIQFFLDEFPQGIFAG